MIFITCVPNSDETGGMSLSLLHISLGRDVDRYQNFVIALSWCFSFVVALSGTFSSYLYHFSLWICEVLLLILSYLFMPLSLLYV